MVAMNKLLSATAFASMLALTAALGVGGVVYPGL